MLYTRTVATRFMHESTNTHQHPYSTLRFATPSARCTLRDACFPRSISKALTKHAKCARRAKEHMNINGIYPPCTPAVSSKANHAHHFDSNPLHKPVVERVRAQPTTHSMNEPETHQRGWGRILFVFKNHPLQFLAHHLLRLPTLSHTLLGTHS